MIMRNKSLFSTASRLISTLSTSTLNRMIQTCIVNNNLESALYLFNHNPTSRDVVSWNNILSGCFQNGQLNHAQKLFDEMPIRNNVSWSTVLSGFCTARKPDSVYECFLGCRRDGAVLNAYTISLVISAFSDTKSSVLVPQIHCWVVRLGFCLNIRVQTALMKGYVNARDRVALKGVFDEILVKDVPKWNLLLTGLMEMQCVNEAEEVFNLMPEKNIVSWTCLINGYINNDRVDKARAVFDSMNERDVVSWTTMINAYVKNENYADALSLFMLMLRSITRPNHFTFSAVLRACALTSSLLLGQQVHASILKSGIPCNVILSTSLVDMYARCGYINAACSVFEAIRNKNLASWNAIIGGYAQHGMGTRALEMFEKMCGDGFTPDEVSFVNVLSACARGGLVKEGERYLKTMKEKYGIEPEIEHYACMVDLYGKAGDLEKAENIIREMNIEPDVVTWIAFLGACALYSTLDNNDFAVKGLEKLKANHPAIYAAFLKIHGEKGSWNNVLELRKHMKNRKTRKQTASSWIEGT